jgi:hypothetical protein
MPIEGRPADGFDGRGAGRERASHRLEDARFLGLVRRSTRSGTIAVVTGRRRRSQRVQNAESELHNLVADMTDFAGFGRRPKISMWTATEERRAKARDYAYVYPSELEFHFSKKILDVDDAHRRAVIAHEVGHCLAQHHWGSSTEDEADRAAAQWIGVPICYDHRWPGKGLQVVCARQNNPCSRAEALAARLMEDL